MKRFISYIKIHAAAISAVVIVLLAGCDKNEQPAPGNDNRIALGVQIIDGGYLPTAGERSDSNHPDTRATENGYKTTFTATDQVGLYAVKNGAVLPTCSNLCLTLTDKGGGNLVWTPPAGTTLTYEDATTTYYAYYPYQTNMTGKVTPSATDATGFFATLENGWTPATDQSTHAKYTAQDLMAGSGTVNGTPGARTLTLDLTHRMALAVINIPAKITYQLSSDADYKWERATSGLTFTNFTPYQKETGIYRLLINPANAPTLQGSYHTVTEGTRSFTITPAISASAYKTYTPRTTYTPVAGDFLMNDGSLISKDAPLSDTDKANCVGIVFYGGKYKLDMYDYSTTNIGKKDCHGYVMACWYAPSSHPDGWLQWATKTNGAHQAAVGVSTSSSYWDGYSNQQKIEKFIEENTTFTLATDFPAANACKIYTPAAPHKSTGWFLPSIAQLHFLKTNETILAASLLKAGSNANIFTSSTGLWSSTEASFPKVYRLLMSNKYEQQAERNATVFVIPILAF